jgi:hypothetical protein
LCFRFSGGCNSYRMILGGRSKSSQLFLHFRHRGRMQDHHGSRHRQIKGVCWVQIQSSFPFLLTVCGVVVSDTDLWCSPIDRLPTQ